MPSTEDDWFVRNADVRNPSAAIRRDPAYFAEECAAAIMNGTLTRTGCATADEILGTFRAGVDDGISDAEFRRFVRQSLAAMHIKSSATS